MKCHKALFLGVMVTSLTIQAHPFTTNKKRSIATLEKYCLATLYAGNAAIAGVAAIGSILLLREPLFINDFKLFSQDMALNALWLYMAYINSKLALHCVKEAHNTLAPKKKLRL